MASRGTVALIRPANVYNYNNYPPLGLICVGSALERAGFGVRIVDRAMERDPDAAVLEAVDGALFAGVGLLTSEAPDAHHVCRLIKERTGLPVVAGGWHVTLFPEQTASSPHVDHAVAGEGEEHAVAIADALAEGRSPGRAVYAKEILDPDALPAPDYDLDPLIERFVTSYLTDKLSRVVAQPMRWLPYESSRGCPSRCTFCINVVTDNRRYRKKSAAKTLDEIEAVVAKHRLTHVKIIDDNFFVDIGRVREVCRGMIERGLEVTWDGECRVDYFNERMLDDETLDQCRRSGLVQLTLGIESGSPHTLELMRKGITPEQAEHAVAQCDRHGIIARSSFILEIPGETVADIKQTVALINRLRRYPMFTCGVGTFRPYPRCELTRKLLEEGYLAEPETFEAWTDRGIVDMYTSAEYVRPWQANGRFSEAAAYYLNMESGVRLGNHQIDRASDRLKNDLFAGIARARNRLMFYGASVDKKMYARFLTRFYEKRRDLEKAGEYPLADFADAEGGR